MTLRPLFIAGWLSDYFVCLLVYFRFTLGAIAFTSARDTAFLDELVVLSNLSSLSFASLLLLSISTSAVISSSWHLVFRAFLLRLLDFIVLCDWSVLFFCALRRTDCLPVLTVFFSFALLNLSSASLTYKDTSLALEDETDLDNPCYILAFFLLLTFFAAYFYFFFLFCIFYITFLLAIVTLRS